MKLIKLDAIDSTNDFLKTLNSQEDLENFTMVTAENQTNGKGQRGATWATESGKNLTLSILTKNTLTPNDQVFDLSVITSLAINQVLEDLNIPQLSIKWPNDIMSYNKKIGGVLIENIHKSGGEIHSIIGIGLNVNQTDFENLPKASSLAVICNKEFDKTIFPELITARIKKTITEWRTNSEKLWQIYFQKLFKKGVPMPFQNTKNEHFMGIILGVSKTGKLQVQLEDDSIAEFDIKEITLLY
ncbi:biotin--[acetyl-CoA-carboxylase] ligase [Flavobacterium agrisoli]|uniref:Biotin--[acetyl-CoA-carboxylase] ligase n=1 Tax=Flavobacterium agrisoli TaxID=2793066 RepID=A0A934PL92_9FLAO|nr:biotin--[acetyl-CoA-carboxylase] ligase [Flavobacterium agrisoli]MBK0368899.1 biotin--[acetyl-CoA-carboxylase] ligase [Flavobacterium agrisoli]